MKALICTIIVCVTSITLYAQHPLAKGQTDINVGVGFSSWGIPIYGGFDHGVSRDVTLGAELAYRSDDDDFDNRKYRGSVLSVSGNFNYHFNTLFHISREWDLYAGLNVGFNMVNYGDGYKGDRTSGLGLGAQIGGRYYFSNTVGLNLEFGGGNAFGGGKLGLTFKL